tara:strand:- start:1163 stop:2137 length:975 start_codon:yes stop_codon:yes gene_type:complete
MPEEEKKTVDIDTSGPDVDIQLPEEKEDSVVETEQPKVETETVEQEKEVKVEEEKKEPVQEEKEKELEQYSESVQRRIAKLTKKWREAERQKDEAVEYAKSQIEAKEIAEKKISKFEPEFFKNAEDSVENGLKAAQAKLAAAREANDLTAEAEALTAISEFGYRRARLAETKNEQEEYNKQLKEKPKPEINLNRQTASAGSPDPKAEDWASKNAWFGQDTAMTYTAFDLHKKLTEDEGFDPSSDEYYSEIDKRIRLEFPHKFANNSDKGENTTKPVQTVASAKRSTNTGRKNSVRLTSSQVAIAKKLGVPLEEYAKQLKITKEA